MGNRSDYDRIQIMMHEMGKVFYFCIAQAIWFAANSRCNSSELRNVFRHDRVFAQVTLSGNASSNQFGDAYPNATSDGTPSVVFLSMYIRSISSINFESMDYVVDLYMQQNWHDGRLKNASNSRAANYQDRKAIQRVWKPEVIFTNSKDSSFHFATLPNVLLKVDPEGNVLYIIRMKIKFDCMFDFFKYPMDVQTCSIELSTFANELQLGWASNAPITLYNKLKLPQFKIASVETYQCNTSYYFGQYSCLKVDFTLERELSYHLVQSYFSTSLIVVISWFSFWLHLDAIAARTTLGVTTLLTISSKGIGIENKLPPVTYLKAMDVWIFVCTTFVFAALLEFSIANYVWRLDDSRKFVSLSNKHVVWWMVNRKDAIEKCKSPPPNFSSARSRAERIDMQSRLLFPVSFLVFIFLYWFYYCCWI